MSFNKFPIENISLLLVTSGITLIFTGIAGLAGAQLFIGLITALAAAYAALMAAKSAQAARDAADQWKVQSRFNTELDSLLELIQAMNAWRNCVISIRSSLGPLLTIATNEKRVHDWIKYRDQTTQSLVRLERLSLNFRTSADKTRILGHYDHESCIDLYALDTKLQKSLRTLTQILAPTLYVLMETAERDEYKIDFSNCCYGGGIDDFQNNLHNSWINFELRYQEMINRLGGKNIQTNKVG
ncbi:MAG: hypothetical protein VB954_12425 [Thalassolituus sp.]|uniref:hypothetical protein n=1 Tax=Thalassolituus sp. TaxID=2030822 RepID=UPI003982D32A